MSIRDVFNQAMKDNFKGRKAIEFLHHLFPSKSATLIKVGGKRNTAVTVHPAAYLASVPDLSRVRKKNNIFVLMAETHAPLSGFTVVKGHLRASRHFGIRTTKDKLGDLENQHPRPFLRADAGNTVYLAWRLFNEVEPDVAEQLGDMIAKRVGGVSLGHFFPLPWTIQQWDKSPITLEYFYKDRLCFVTDFIQSEGQAEAAITLASEIKPESISWLWPNVIPRGALSLIAGPGGVGKSTIAAYIASVVSYGGTFPDGSRIEPSGVMFFEVEDSTSSVVIPRLQAVGADLNKIVTGSVTDLSHDVTALEAGRKKLGGDVSLLVLSPIRSFFGPESYIETEVRERLKMVLAWAETHGVAVLGVSHPPRGKQDIAGATAWKNLARAGLFADVDPKDKTHRVLFPLKANNAPDTWRLRYEIDGVRLPGTIIETSRIRWAVDASQKRQESQRASSSIVDSQTSTPVYELPGGSQGTSNQVADKPKRKNKRRDQTDAWLHGLLTKYGPLPLTDIRAAAVVSKVSVRSLSDAAIRLGVERKRSEFGGKLTWSL